MKKIALTLKATLLCSLACACSSTSAQSCVDWKRKYFWHVSEELHRPASTLFVARRQGVVLQEVVMSRLKSGYMSNLAQIMEARSEPEYETLIFHACKSAELFEKALADATRSEDIAMLKINAQAMDELNCNGNRGLIDGDGG